jgi:hypothetical protein
VAARDQTAHMIVKRPLASSAREVVPNRDSHDRDIRALASMKPQRDGHATGVESNQDDRRPENTNGGRASSDRLTVRPNIRPVHMVLWRETTASIAFMSSTVLAVSFVTRCLDNSTPSTTRRALRES